MIDVVKVQERPRRVARRGRCRIGAEPESDMDSGSARTCVVRSTESVHPAVPAAADVAAPGDATLGSADRGGDPVVAGAVDGDVHGAVGVPAGAPARDVLSIDVEGCVEVVL